MNTSELGLIPASRMMEAFDFRMGKRIAAVEQALQAYDNAKEKLK